jgi:hypothetical protein
MSERFEAIPRQAGAEARLWAQAYPRIDAFPKVKYAAAAKFSAAARRGA